MTRHLVIGSGSIARRHIANLRHMFPEGDVGCLSASGRVLNDGETDASVVLASFDAALAWSPDFAVVASPAPFHLGHALPLLDRGIPVLIEKPLSDSVATFSALAERLLPHRQRIEVSYNLRYLSSAQRMKELVEAATVGAVRSISVDMGQYLPDWRPHDNYRRNVSARRELGGGVLLELSHEFDYLTWLFGKFDAVYCLASNSGALDIDVEDRADIVLSRDDGLVAHMHMDFLQRKATRCCKVVGEHGNLVWNLIANTITHETNEGSAILFSDAAYDRNDMYRQQLARFAEFSKGARTAAVGLDSAVYTLEMIEAMRESAASKMPVSLRGLKR